MGRKLEKLREEWEEEAFQVHKWKQKDGSIYVLCKKDTSDDKTNKYFLVKYIPTIRDEMFQVDVKFRTTGEESAMINIIKEGWR